ncbi:suppressor of fused domain protein [Saccharopolyspora gregorii]|uniref:suppressor of fused domain protein n=1 Tax=Saccharopolyspora gregorii TaxID=33914 RepID=UPI0021ABD627|nr:suppressor of fused domain protein [Saccharopolyspora gregorii]
MNLDVLRAHYARFFGVLTASEIADEIEIARWDRPEFASVSTLGLCRKRITAIYPQELVCSVKPEQAGAAQVLVRGTLEMIASLGRGMVHQSVITNEEPLLPETDIHGVLVAAHPYLDDAFNVVFGPGRTVLVDIMTLIPITAAEAALARGGNVERLLDAFEAADPELTDITRRSVV